MRLLNKCSKCDRPLLNLREVNASASITLKCILGTCQCGSKYLKCDNSCQRARYFDTSSKLKPYVGLGVNYTIFFDEDFNSAPKSLGFSDLDLDASWGYSVQIGADYHIDDKWSINWKCNGIRLSS